MNTLLNDIKTEQFRPVYLLCGEEAYLRRQYRDRLGSAIVPAEDTMNRTVYSGSKTDPQAVIDTGETMPFFAERRLIVIEDSGFLKSASPELADYIQRIPDYLHLIFVENEIDKRNGLYKAIQKAGYVCEFNRMDEKKLAAWAGKMLADAGRKIRTSDMEYFLTCTGNDMTHIRLEIDKLINYTEGREIIERDDIAAVTSVEIENRIFEMIRCVTEGKKQRALALYADLVALKEPSLRILALLARQYSQMLMTKLLAAERTDQGEIAKLIGAPPFAVRNYLRTVRNLSADQLREAVEKCAQTEEDIKNGRMPDRLAVELLLLTA